jgi:hypothetical protein
MTDKIEVLIINNEDGSEVSPRNLKYMFAVHHHIIGKHHNSKTDYFMWLNSPTWAQTSSLWRF